MPHPFDLEGPWLRCALHAHTTNSDGELSPPLLVRHYERAGFDALAITDHHVRTDEPSTDGLLMLPSTEIDVRVGGRVAHLLALGVAGNPWPRRRGPVDVAEAVAWTAENGGVSFLAHPYWSGLDAGDVAACDGLAGIEVYNAGCELEVAQGLATVHWDAALTAGRRWHGIATDDTHHPGFDSGHAWTWVRAVERSPKALVDALRAGSFYGSTGPQIEDLRVGDGAIEVTCTAARRITLVAGPGRGTSVAAGRLGYVHRGEILTQDACGITAARLEIPAETPFARLEVHGAEGGTAWTNPLP